MEQINELKLIQANITKQLLSIQNRLRAVSEDGEQKLAQNDKMLRKKMAEVMVLKSNTGIHTYITIYSTYLYTLLSTLILILIRILICV